MRHRPVTTAGQPHTPACPGPGCGGDAPKGPRGRRGGRCDAPAGTAQARLARTKPGTGPAPNARASHRHPPVRAAAGPDLRNAPARQTVRRPGTTPQRGKGRDQARAAGTTATPRKGGPTGRVQRPRPRGTPQRGRRGGGPTPRRGQVRPPSPGPSRGTGQPRASTGTERPPARAAAGPDLRNTPARQIRTAAERHAPAGAHPGGARAGAEPEKPGQRLRREKRADRGTSSGPRPRGTPSAATRTTAGRHAP